ncbi:hypothetical protein IFM89_034906 [Coptis chinensis]|uniref:NF-kappa-B-activating protein C-terminal domain-containing protein n=1 Tax=Coptis chinensis TaxID=261450 RepID=A0A835LXB6_9MAGN|nr:hypothetical protein IFM89_034906 [Coptis chinensis]
MMSRRRGDEKDSRLSSKVEIPERISPEQQQQGTKTRNYNYKSRDYSRTSPRYDEYDHRNSTGKFLDREYNNNNGYNRNGKMNESDEELKGLSYEEYRTTKRIKLRKNIRNCIYRITPSPPRSEWDLQEEDENEGDIEIEGDGKEQVGKGLSSSDGDDESESDEDMREKKKKRRRKSSKKSKRRNDSESDESDESESDTDRRRKRKSGSKKRSNWRSKKSKKRSSRVDSDESESEDIESDKSESGSADDNVRTKNRRSSSSASHSKSSKKKKRSESVSEGSEKSLLDSDTDKKIIEIDDDGLKAEMNSEALAFKEMLELQKKSGLESDAVVGPMPLPRAEGHISYGGALRPGEGDAIAQYVQQGKRIPRRGEVGLSADEIQRFEDLGYVMSGSRHQRMNAIRIRKENQVYSAEDKRALAMFNYEEKAKREHKVMADLQRLVQRHIGEDVGPTHDPFGGKATDDADT